MKNLWILWTATGYLLIANKTTSLDESYMPDDLTDLADTRADGRAVQKLRNNAAKAFEAMFIEMRACGYTDVSITSGYRSYSYQASLFEEYTNKELANTPAGHVNRLKKWPRHIRRAPEQASIKQDFAATCIIFQLQIKPLQINLLTPGFATIRGNSV